MIRLKTLMYATIKNNIKASTLNDDYCFIVQKIANIIKIIHYFMTINRIFLKKLFILQTIS